MENIVTPWFYFSKFDNKESDRSGVTNPAGPMPTTNNVSYNSTSLGANGVPNNLFNDNGLTWGLGTEFNGLGKGWTPFLSLIETSGVFLKDPTGVTGLGTETRTDTTVQLGVIGTI